MNRFLHGMMSAVVQSFRLPDPVVEIGSYQVDPLVNLRSLFATPHYFGLDMRSGPGVDFMADAEQLPLADHSVGTLLSLSTLEHVPHFWKAVTQFRRVLRPDGVLVVSCPFYFHMHQHPNDYWRFTPDALDLLFSDMPRRVIGWHGAKNKPSSVWCVAFGPEYPLIDETHLQCYREHMQQLAHEPISWRRRLTFTLAGCLIGRGPFAPYLDRNRWDMIHPGLPQRMAS